MKKTLILSLFILMGLWVQAQAVTNPAVNSNSSSGWVPFQIITGKILIPVKINGHAAIAYLVNSVPTQTSQGFIDNNKEIFTLPASQQGLPAALKVQIGNLTVSQPANVKPSRHQIIGPAIDMVLGDELFKDFIVDIDFPNRRMSVRRPENFKLPVGVKTLAFKMDGDSRAVPASVEHGPEMFYWVYMGDPAPVSVYQSYYVPHAILQQRAVSVRLGGGSKTPPEAIATLKEVSLSGLVFKRVPAVFPNDSVTGKYPADVAGHVGLALLSRNRIIFDYGHDQLYVIPGNAAVIKASFAKDRSGLVIQQVKDDYVVKFVCPGSPALKAGFRAGDTVVKVNNKPMPSLLGTAWQTPAWGNVHAIKAGVNYIFTLKDNTKRRLTTAEYF